MKEDEFLNNLFLLLDEEIEGLDKTKKLYLMQEVLSLIPYDPEKGRVIKCNLIPFVTGRRPVDEALYSGLGSSENISLLLPDDNLQENYTYLLYTIEGLENCDPSILENLKLDITLSFCGPDGSLSTSPLSGWNRRPINPSVFDLSTTGTPILQAIPLSKAMNKRLVLRFSPSEDFLPGKDWLWESLDKQIKSSATDFCDPFTLGHLFSQELLIQLRVTFKQVPIATANTYLNVCDTRRIGSLYKRILEKLIIPDTEKQAKIAGVENLEYTYHPLFPVLSIGLDKASLYTNALIEDIVSKKHHLTDPKWLMKVGLYLELLTCLGIFEAAKDIFGDFLTPAERFIFENSPHFAKIRKYINPKKWGEVLELHKIAFSKFGMPQTGPVSFFNLIHKQRTTLAFLEVHHQDLLHAIEIVGSNIHNAQETWHRVFRDAERAVLRKTVEAFPEIHFLNPKIRDFIQWHEQGKLEIPTLQWIPKQFSMWLGDQDGLFASACNKYRQSMNQVAFWAKEQGLMDYTGCECVPANVSLLQAYMKGQQSLVERLQLHDGYTTESNIQVQLPVEIKNIAEIVYNLISAVPYFAILSEEDRKQIARSARMITLGPMERIVIQGRRGSSLFIVGEGSLEALIRQTDGNDKCVGMLEKGDVIGEISLLTGEPRSATVRAIDGAVVFEIGKQHYEPIIQSRPELVSELALIMETRLKANQTAPISEIKPQDYKKRIWDFFFPEYAQKLSRD